MEFGVVLQTNPPASRVVELATRAEQLGFHYAWTFDSHILWEEPFVIYSQILASTRSLKVGCSELSQLKTRFGLNPVKPSPNFTGLASGSQ